jgi:ATP-binding cassette, subfamily B, multidrug efflux pump
MLLGLACAGGVFRYLMRLILIGASRDIEFDLRNAFFARLQQMPLSYYQQHRTGDLMSRATNDLNAVRMMIGPAIMYTASTVLVFVVAILLMLSIDPLVDGDGAAAAAARVAERPVFRAGDSHALRAIQEQLSHLSAVVQESSRRCARRARVQPGSARDARASAPPTRSTCAATGG